MLVADQIRHYEARWGCEGKLTKFERGPVHTLPADFAVLVFPPREQRQMWTYATIGLAAAQHPHLELHLHAPAASEIHVESLTVVAWFHLHRARLDHGHTMNLGRPWLGDSDCTRVLLSLPYLDGPELEWEAEPERGAHYLWLIPVTPSEVEFKAREGLDALEQRFEESGFNYLDPARPAVA